MITISWDDVEKTSGDSGTKMPYTTFGAGNTLIRVLDDGPYSFWNHWMAKHNTGVSCLGKGCPICSVIANQKANKEPPIYSSTQRHAIRIWNYSTNQQENMIQSKTFFAQLLNLHKEVGDIKTYDIKVTRKGKETETTYMLLPTTPKDFEFMDKVVDVDFAETLKPMEKQQMLDLMSGKSFDEVFGKKEEDAE